MALLLPFICFVFVIGVDYARIFYFSLTVSNCARNGALYGSQDTAHAIDTAGIKTAAQIDGGSLTLASLNVSSATDSSTSPTYVDVTVTYPFSTLSNFPGVTKTTTLSRTVRMLVVPAVPSF